MNSLIINEIFYSLQGETELVGLPTVFVRLTGCPLRCRYCDTEYAFTEGLKKTFSEIDQMISKYNCNRVTITGGEPLAQPSCERFLNEYCNSIISHLKQVMHIQLKTLIKIFKLFLI